MTINWRENERKMVEFMNAKMVEIGRAMGAKEVNPFPGYSNYDVTRYQSRTSRAAPSWPSLPTAAW